MGTSQSFMNQQTINVLPYDDGCALAPWIHSVLGLGSGTMSISDQWLITLVPNKVMYQGEPIDKVFVKVIPNVTDHPDPYINTSLSDVQTEVKIYADVIKPLIDKRICPFFLPVLNVSKNCTAQSLIEMLRDKAPFTGYKRKVPDGYPTEPFDAETVFVRNMVLSLYHYNSKEMISQYKNMFDTELEYNHLNSFYTDDKKHVNNAGFLKSFTTGADIVSIHSPTNIESVNSRKSQILSGTYTMLYTLPVEGGETASTLINQILTENNLQGLYFYCFQLSIALTAMCWSKIFHNDLHENNVLIQSLDKTEKFTYVVGSTMYTYSTNKIPIVFDFDRSIVKRIDTVTDDSIFYRDLWSVFFLYYVSVDDFPLEFRNMIISVLILPKHQNRIKNYWNRVYAKYKEHPFKFEIGRNYLNRSIMMECTNMFDIIVENWAKAANVNHMSIFDQKALPILQQTERKQYFLNYNSFDEESGVIKESDPFSIIYNLIEVGSMIDSKKAEDIIQRKQVLARQNLELLQLQLEIEKKTNRK
jgi:hypothetical protein